MAAIDIGWTPSLVKNVRLALEVTLARVPEESLRGTAIAENWRKAHEWTQTVRQLTDHADEAFRLDQVPPFPLTSQELKALEASIDRIAQAHAAASATDIGKTAHHVRHSLRHLSWSSYALGALLMAGVAAGVVNITVFHGEQSPWNVGLSLAGSCLALVVWFWHRYQLGAHKSVLEQAGHA